MYDIIPVSSAVFMAGTKLFKSKMSLQDKKNINSISDFKLDKEKEEALKNPNKQRDKLCLVPLSQRFQKPEVGQYLSAAFGVKDPSMDDREDESLVFYHLMRQLFEIHFTNNNEVEIEYMVVGDSSGTINIYAVSELIKYKGITNGEFKKKEAFSVPFSLLVSEPSDDPTSFFLGATREPGRDAGSDHETTVRYEFVRPTHPGRKRMFEGEIDQGARGEDNALGKDGPCEV